MNIVRSTSLPDVRPPDRGVLLALVAGLGVIGVLLAGGLLLWMRYGTAVFFEMIAAGIAACF